MKILIAGRMEKTESYRKALEAMDVPYDVRLQGIDVSSYDGLILPGGCDIDPSRYGQEMNGSMNTDPELDEAQFAAFGLFRDAGKPILGICRGHQLVNVALGGSLIQHLPTAPSHVKVDDEHYNHHMATAESGSFMEKLYGGKFVVNSSHHQACNRIGEGLKVALRADDGTVEALEHESLPIISVQWHPERTGFAFLSDEAVDGQRVFEHFISLCRRECRQEWKYQIYIGYNDPQLGKELVSEEELTGIVTSFFEKRGIGFSIMDCDGGYMNIEGRLVLERTMVITIVGEQDLDIGKLSKALSMYMNQECIMVTRITTDMRYM